MTFTHTGNVLFFDVALLKSIFRGLAQLLDGLFENDLAFNFQKNVRKITTKVSTLKSKVLGCNITKYVPDSRCIF